MSIKPKGKKVAVAGLTFETNSFSPDLTHLDTFQRLADPPAGKPNLESAGVLFVVNS